MKICPILDLPALKCTILGAWLTQCWNAVLNRVNLFLKNLIRVGSLWCFIFLSRVACLLLICLYPTLRLIWLLDRQLASKLFVKLVLSGLKDKCKVTGNSFLSCDRRFSCSLVHLFPVLLLLVCPARVFVVVLLWLYSITWRTWNLRDCLSLGSSSSILSVVRIILWDVYSFI